MIRVVITGNILGEKNISFKTTSYRFFLKDGVQMLAFPDPENLQREKQFIATRFIEAIDETEVEQ